MRVPIQELVDDGVRIAPQHAPVLAAGLHARVVRQNGLQVTGKLRVALPTFVVGIFYL